MEINLIINNKNIIAQSDKTILEVARENNIEIDTLCFIKNCSDITRCGICRIEDVKNKKLIGSCSTLVEEGMILNTASRLVQESKKERISDLLNDHNFKCGTCKRVQNCEFLELIKKTGAKKTEMKENLDREELKDNRSKSISLDRTKCLKCGRCVNICRSKAGTSIIQLNEIDGEEFVGPENLKCFDDTNCLLCGQCIAACPVGALSEKSHIERVVDALKDNSKHVVVGMAPSVRTSLGELFQGKVGTDVTKKIYSALRKIGFGKVFDVNFAADITIVEEGTELIDRIKNNGTFPMFTSCCPGWIRFVEQFKPEYIRNLSTAKSPQQIFGAATKNYYPALEKIDPKSIFTVSVMPCVAKKFESEREEMETNGNRDIDAVLTTRELADLIKIYNIDFKNLKESEADPMMGSYTGAGTIFGVTGGVMEAAVRSVKDILEGSSFENIEYRGVRGFDGIKETTVKISGNDYNLAVVSGGANIMKFFDENLIAKNNYHFVEFMACPGGCINGGGQPHVKMSERESSNYVQLRGDVLYSQDKN
ncbi:MAG: [FeFe] hydrogenase, group A, partial [Fusobacteriaceae bacterium]